MPLPTLVRSSLVASSLVAAVVGGGACATAPSGDAAVDDARSDGSGGGDDVVAPAALVAGLLTGRFDSSAQAATDTRYYPVQLRVCAVDVPALGDHVLYVEQAMLSALDQPYRQRVYVVTENADGAVVSTVSELVQPSMFVGFCDLDERDQRGIMPLPEDIRELVGCAVTLTKDADGRFTGSTDGASCLNDYGGATYATSDVTLTDTGIDSWDRGYDANGVQVWGAVAGPYRFDRKQ